MAAEPEWDWGSSQVGSAAENYQRFMGPGMFGPFAVALVRELGIQPGQRVLDVACGTGVLTRVAAAAAGEGGTITAVDLGAPMLEVARAQPEEPGAAPITYME